MAHVQAGTIAKNSRRRSALERLEKHLSDHKANHPDDVILGEAWFKDHDTIQKAELERLKKNLQ